MEKGKKRLAMRNGRKSEVLRDHMAVNIEAGSISVSSLVDSPDQCNQVFETAKKTDIAEIKTGLVALTEKFAICSKEKRYQDQLKSEMTKLLSVFSSPTPPSNEKLLGVIQSLPTTLAKTCTATSGSDQVSNIQDQPKTKKNDTESPSFNANQKFNVDAKQGEGKPLVINFLLTDKNYEFESISLNGENIKILSPQATNIPVLLSNPQEVIRIAGKIKGVKGSFSTKFIMRRGDAFTVTFSPQS